MHALGCIFGAELQFSDWTVTGRKRPSEGGAFGPSQESVSAALRILPTWYGKQSSDAKRVITNALFMHNHTPSYEWEWERFLWQYVAFDGCWFALQGIGNQTPHHLRLKKFAKYYDLVIEEAAFAEWVRIRNELIHEVSWGGAMLGLQADIRARKAYLPLRSFTTRALLAVMGFGSDSVKTDWRSAFQMVLEAPRNEKSA